MHHNPNVVVFAIRMIHAFHQVDAVPNLIIAMHHENDSVKKVAIKAITELGDTVALK
jgi:HEAT repeat protein